MTARSPQIIPAFGVVHGGERAGDRYTFHRFVRRAADGRLLAEISVAPPNWPFPPRLLRMEPGRDFHRLAAARGERPPNYMRAELIKKAVMV